MTEITIPKSEYDNLLSIKAKSETLEEKVKALETETQNKSVAIEEARKKTDEAKKQAKVEFDSLKSNFDKLNEKLWVKDWEDIFAKLEDLSWKAQKFWEFEEKTKQERIAKIDTYKKTLWDEFLKTKASLFDWLSDEKQEILLAEYVSQQSNWKPVPKVDLHKDWITPPQGWSNFDKLISSWTASVSDLISAMD